VSPGVSGQAACLLAHGAGFGGIHSAFFAKLASEPDTVFLVAEDEGHMQGFVIARKFPTPPVYAPGGSTWLIDDFCVATPDAWQTAGKVLLAEASAAARARGAGQVVVVCGDHDHAKAELLARLAYRSPATGGQNPWRVDWKITPSVCRQAKAYRDGRK
jgi:hypothetical protein